MPEHSAFVVQLCCTPGTGRGLPVPGIMANGQCRGGNLQPGLALSQQGPMDKQSEHNGSGFGANGGAPMPAPGRSGTANSNGNGNNSGAHTMRAPIPLRRAPVNPPPVETVMLGSVL